MLNLELFTGTRWIDLIAGVRIEVVPMGASLMQRVWSDPGLELTEVEAPGDGAAEDDDDDGEARVHVAPIAFAKAVARAAIVGWEGVGDGEGAALPVEPRWIDALMECEPVHAAFRRLYLVPGMSVVDEGNVSPASPSGSSAAAGTTAGPAPDAARTAPPSATPPAAGRAGRSGS